MSKHLIKTPKIYVQALYFLLSLAMIGVGLYLTSHYIDFHFPDGLSTKSLCNFNGPLFSCKNAAESHLSNIFGVPISLFAVILGTLFLSNYLFNSLKLEETNGLIAYVNAIGCLILGVYSLLVLKTICPYCFLYYLLSFGVAFLFWKFGTAKFHGKNFALISLFALLILGPSFFYFKDKAQSFNAHTKDLEVAMLQSFDANPNLGAPTNPSPFRLSSANPDFKSAPIQLTIFSDFQCPACKMLSDVLHDVLARFEGKINAQYIFYPLDMNCNPEVKQAMHEYACQEAYIAYCAGAARFSVLHDILFSEQENLSANFIKNLAEKENVTNCYLDPATKEKVQALIKESTPFNIRSTPTMILNGVKIEGVLPKNQLIALIEGLLKRIEQK